MKPRNVPLQTIVVALHVSTILLAGTANAWSPPSHPESPSIILHVDQSTPLTSGTTAIPPMVSVPCSIVGSTSTAGAAPLHELIQPPNVETLYDWYVNVQKKPDADPSWAVIWPTAVSLANYLLAHPSRVHNKRVVELGCGLGLAGLTAAILGAKEVWLTDREPFALHCAMSTAAVHQLSVVRAAVLDWNDDSIIDANILQSADIILASDVLYDKECIEAFVNICTKIASPNGALVLLTDPVEQRTPQARELLREALNRSNNSVKKEELGLPSPKLSTGESEGEKNPVEEASSMDGKDHERRMQEPTILLSFGIN